MRAMCHMSWRKRNRDRENIMPRLSGFLLFSILFHIDKILLAGRIPIQLNL